MTLELSGTADTSELPDGLSEPTSAVYWCSVMRHHFLCEKQSILDLNTYGKRALFDVPVSDVNSEAVLDGCDLRHGV